MEFACAGLQHKVCCAQFVCLSPHILLAKKPDVQRVPVLLRPERR